MGGSKHATARMGQPNATSPTVSSEATLLTAVIDAEEGRDVATCDIPNAFIQTHLDDCNGLDSSQPRTIMKITGILVDILCEMDETYEQYVVQERNGRQSERRDSNLIAIAFKILPLEQKMISTRTSPVVTHPSTTRA